MDQHHWIFISPHFDDVALSCGGLAWDLARQGHRVEIWTLMGGFPPDENYSEFAQNIHLTWGISGQAAIQERRLEDQAACHVLDVHWQHFDWPDAIYRRDPKTDEALVRNNDELFGKPPEDTLVESIWRTLSEDVPPNAQIVFPIGLGDHIDHRAVSLAGEKLSNSKWYYADYPYILKTLDFTAQEEHHFEKQPYPLNHAALAHWQDAVLSYKSQLSTFWQDEQETRLALTNYQAGGGGRLWQKTAR